MSCDYGKSFVLYVIVFLRYKFHFEERPTEMIFHLLGNSCEYRDDNHEISSPKRSRRVERTASSSQYGERTGSGAQGKSFQRGQSGGYGTQQKGSLISLLSKLLV